MADKRRVRAPVQKAAGPGKEIGASGLNYSISGDVQEELHPNLMGRQAIKVWGSMRDDAVIGAILYSVEMLARQVEWRVDQEDAKEADKTFLEECMDDMSHSWGDFISEAFSMLPYGFSFHEIVYKKRSGEQPEESEVPSSKHKDGKVGWRKFPIRSQDSLDHWEFDDDGGVTAFVQKPPPSLEDKPIPMVKGLLFRTVVYKNNPEGRSVLRSAYESWYYKRRIRQIEGVGIERDLAGFPTFWLPAEFLANDATADQKAVVNSFKTMGSNIRRDKQEFVIMPLAYDANGNKAYDFTLMNAGGARAFDTSGIIERYNKEIAMTVLADFILLGHEGVGSFALSSDKTDLFAVALGTFLKSIEDVLNRYAVPRLFALNGMTTENLPAIRCGDIEKPDLAALGAYITSLTNSGMTLFPDEDLDAYLREAGNLPEKSEETKKAQEEAKDEQQQPGGDGTGAPGGSEQPGGDTGSPVADLGADLAAERDQGAGAGGGRTA